MPSKTIIICKCGCGRKKEVRTADVKRNWGLFYDKSCKARYQSRTGGSDSYYKAKRRKRKPIFGVVEDSDYYDSKDY